MSKQISGALICFFWSQKNQVGQRS